MRTYKKRHVVSRLFSFLFLLLFLSVMSVLHLISRSVQLFNSVFPFITKLANVIFSYDFYIKRIDSGISQTDVSGEEVPYETTAGEHVFPLSSCMQVDG
jgi:hypothetical protein